MKNSKLVTILSVLKPTDIKQLLKFLSSPYFNTDTVVTNLYILLSKQHPYFNEKAVNKEKLFYKLFPKTNYNDLKMRRLASKLLKLIEQFISLENYQQKKLAQQISLLDFYEEHALIKPFKSSLQTGLELLEKSDFKDANYYHYAFLLNEKERISLLLDKKESRNQKVSKNYQQLINKLETQHLIEKLQICCSVYSQNKIIPYNFTVFLLPEMIEQLANSVFLQIPLIKLYYTALLMLKHSNKVLYFDALQQQLAQYASSLPTRDLNVLYVFAKNYCIQQINQGKDSFFQQLFELFNDELQHFVQDRQQGITATGCKNIISTALRLGKLEWAENFIHHYKTFIVAEYREDVFRYNLAHLYLYKKNYSEAISLLYQSEFKDIFFKIDAKKMRLQIYHELDEIDARDNLINSLRVFMHSKKELITPIHLKKTRNFLNFLTAISKIIPKDKIAINKLKNELQNTASVAEKRWLQIQIEKL